MYCAFRNAMEAERANKKNMNKDSVKTDRNVMRAGKATTQEGKISTQELAKLKEIEARVERLKSINDYRTREFGKDLVPLKILGIYFSKNDSKFWYFDKLSDLGIISVFEKVWTKHFTDYFMDESENDLQNNMRHILGMMVDGTDSSKKLCEAMLDHKTHDLIMKWITDPKLAPDKTDEISNTLEHDTVDSIFSVIYNISMKCDARQIFREAGVVQALIPFLQSPDLMVSISPDFIGFILRKPPALGLVFFSIAVL